MRELLGYGRGAACSATGYTDEQRSFDDWSAELWGGSYWRHKRVEQSGEGE